MDVFYRDYLAQKDHPIDDETLKQALVSLEGAALKFSADAISDAAQRENYNRNVRRVKEAVLEQVKSGKVTVKEAAQFCYEARNNIMAEVRARTSPQGLAIAEARKKIPLGLADILDEKAINKFGGTFVELDVKQKNLMYYEIVESSARPNVTFNTMNKVLRVSGKVLVVVTIAYATYDIATAENKPKAAIKQGVIVGSGLVGTALAGAAVSAVCGPGAPFCAIGLMLGAGIASGWGASLVTESLDEELEEVLKWGVG